MENTEWISVISDTEAKLVPVGTPITLPKGSLVRITQDKGDSVTVSINGNLARVSGEFRENLGLKASDVQQSIQSKLLDGPANEEAIWDKLKSCYDPEIPVNVVDLGLIYQCKIEAAENNLGSYVTIDMTLTAPGCGMGPVLAEEIHQKLLSLDNVKDATVNLVFDPPWTQDKMSEAAQLELGLL